MRIHTLFAAGEAGYAAYRIPSLLALPGGRVLAFCEARRDSPEDAGVIRVALRLSRDGGRTFDAARVVAQDGEATVGNPTPVYDRQTNVVFLLLNGNERTGGEREILRGQGVRRTLIAHSGDLGDTWSRLTDLGGQARRPGWTWHAFGPCHAIQTRAGRLVVPCNHAVLDAARGTSSPYRAGALLSDDHGRSWRMGADVGDDTNECAIAQLPSGRLYINMRSYHDLGCRHVAYSDDGGESWTPPVPDTQLPEPVCQASLLSYEHAGGHALLFANPADALARKRLTLRVSDDGGARWNKGRVLWPGPAAYSDIAAADGRILCLFECGERSPYERIALAELSPESVMREDPS